jgi:type IV pilus assembly protein PilN
MNSFLAVEENKDKAPSSIVPRVEEGYGTFVVTADLDEIAQPVASDAAAPEQANAVNNSTAGAAQ